MRKILLVSITTLIMLTVGMVSTGFAAETLKVGIVDLFRALNESDVGKRAISDMEVMIKSKESDIEEMRKNIEELRAELQKQAAVISPEAKKEKEQEIERLTKDFQRLVADSQAEIRKKDEKLTGEILRELREVINKIGQDDGYSLILEQYESGVLFFSKTVAITDKVIKKYNEMKKK